MNLGLAVVVSSLRKSWEKSFGAVVGTGPEAPSATYIRVLSFGKVVTVISGRIAEFVESNDFLICTHVVPASVERHTPRAYDAAYTMSGFDGSSSTRRTPNGEHGASFSNSFKSPVHSDALVDPSWMKAQVRPPSV